MRKGKLFFQISRVFYLPIYYKGIKNRITPSISIILFTIFLFTICFSI